MIYGRSMIRGALVSWAEALPPPHPTGLEVLSNALATVTLMDDFSRAGGPAIEFAPSL